MTVDYGLLLEAILIDSPGCVFEEIQFCVWERLYA